MRIYDFANERDNVVVFIVGVGFPNGVETVMGHPEIVTVEDLKLGDLDGEVGPDGTWRWNGDGTVRDYDQNSITGISASVNQVAYARNVKEYTQEC